MKYTFTPLLIYLLWISHIPASFGQTSGKLAPDNNTIKIIGTYYSVNYSNGEPSTTVNPKANVFDGDLNTFFASYDRSYTWVGLDLGEPYIITKIKYCPRIEFGSRLQLGVFEGANQADFSDAIPLYVITDVPEEEQLTEKSIANSRGFRYVRYVGPSDVRCNIAELEFYGYKGLGNNSQLTQITNIPDVIIHTENNQEINSRDDYVNGTVTFISEDGTDNFTSKIEIRGRGNASWSFDKKPYRIKLESTARVLGLPAKARNWTLISNHGDKTLMRNLLAFDISKRLRMPYTPAGRAVNLFLNGEYKGCYQLCDHIDVRKERVNVREMTQDDISGEALTGGYLVEIDAYFYTEHLAFSSKRGGIPVVIKSPQYDEITPEQTGYIISHFNRLEEAVFAPDYTDTVLGFRKYMDTETFVKFFLVGELSGNTDTYWSVNMYKQRGDERFYYGPVWDFDLAFENDNRTYPINDLNDWIFKSGGSAANGMREFVDRLFSDSLLCDELRTTWSNFRDWGIISDTALLNTVDKYAAEIYDSQELNFIRWKIRNEWVHQMWGRSDTYEGDVKIVKDYIAARIQWIDEKLNYIPDPDNKNPYVGISGPRENIAWSVTPGYIHIRRIPEPSHIEIFSVSGQTVYRQTAAGDLSVPVRKGIYILRISGKNNQVKILKCRVD